ncbi:MAG: RNA-binding domain-containing protein [Desulfonatronovibrio sp.]|nr:putative DNA binding domain-containing protein [Desulfovibrionales bacterium]
MKKQELLELIEAGENSGVEFKLDNIRPEQLAKEAVAFANLQGGVILLGVSDEKEIVGLARPNVEEWVMDTVFSRYIHPAIIPFYQEIPVDDGKRIAMLSISAGTAKPYVLRHKDREDIYIRMGSTSKLATREQVVRLFDSGGLLHVETLPVSGTSIKNMDQARLDNYLRDILREPEVPVTSEEWSERLQGLGFITRDSLGQEVCTIAGMVLFGVNPRRYLPQTGLRLMAFSVAEKQYQALLDVVLDGPMVGRWSVEKGQVKSLVDEGLVEKFVRTMEPFLTEESNEIGQSFRREKTWRYPVEAVREVVLNALVHRDWTRSVDIEITRYNDRLEVISPGALPNSMTIEKMKAGRRTPRNPVIMEVMRDYGYVDARGMGIRTKVIPLTRQFFGIDPWFEAGEDYLKTIISGPLDKKNVFENVPENVLEKRAMSLKKDIKHYPVPENVHRKDRPEIILSLIKANPSITYNDLARQTGLNRKNIQRTIQDLKNQGYLKRVGSARKGHWEILSQQS